MKRAILLLALACSARVGPRAQAPAAATRSAPGAQRVEQPNPYIITPAERRLLRALGD